MRRKRVMKREPLKNKYVEEKEALTDKEMPNEK